MHVLINFPLFPSHYLSKAISHFHEWDFHNFLSFASRFLSFSSVRRSSALVRMHCSVLLFQFNVIRFNRTINVFFLENRKEKFQTKPKEMKDKAREKNNNQNYHHWYELPFHARHLFTLSAAFAFVELLPFCLSQLTLFSFKHTAIHFVPMMMMPYVKWCWYSS